MCRVKNPRRSTRVRAPPSVTARTRARKDLLRVRDPGLRTVSWSGRAGGGQVTRLLELAQAPRPVRIVDGAARLFRRRGNRSAAKPLLGSASRRPIAARPPTARTTSGTSDGGGGSSYPTLARRGASVLDTRHRVVRGAGGRVRRLARKTIRRDPAAFGLGVARRRGRDRSPSRAQQGPPGRPRPSTRSSRLRPRGLAIVCGGHRHRCDAAPGYSCRSSFLRLRFGLRFGRGRPSF